MHELNSIKQRVRAGDRAVLHFAALFQGLVGDRLVGQVHPIGGERQRFGNSAPRVGQGQAERAHLGALVRIGGRNESALFLGDQVFAASFKGEQFASHPFTFT